MPGEVGEARREVYSELYIKQRIEHMNSIIGRLHHHVLPATCESTFRDQTSETELPNHFSLKAFQLFS